MVKYSKQRDFGAKGRKSRKMGKKMWTHRSSWRLKSDAKRSAKRFRSRGLMARVVKRTRGYGVYTHTK